jgi:hypothetical protein
MLFRIFSLAIILGGFAEGTTIFAQELTEGQTVEVDPSGLDASSEPKATPYKSLHGFDIATGGIFPLTSFEKSYSPNFDLSLGYVWDFREYLLEFRGDFTQEFGRANYSGFMLGLGGSYVIRSEEKLAIFAGSQLGFANFTTLKTAYEDGATGFYTAGEIGVLLWRQADVNFVARSRLGLLWGPLNNTVPLWMALLVGIRF